MVMFLRSHARTEKEEEREKNKRQREKDGISDYFKFLPLEITLDILTRLPTESVLDSKLVCTNWRSVVGHPSFSKMHFHHHLNHPSSESAGMLGFLVLTGRDFRLHYFEYNQNHDQSTSPIHRITRINCTPPFKQFRFLGSINGLVCLLNCDQSVYICNPITREYVILPKIHRHSYTDVYNYEESSFGYVSSTDEYKVVGFYKSETRLEVHIYTLGSGNGWRNLGKFNDGSQSLDLRHRIFFANGVLCWVDEELGMIGTFDLAGEKFGEHLSLPPMPTNTEWYDFSIGVLDGILFLALENEEGRFSDIWLLKKKNHNHVKEEGAEHQSLDWNKEFTIDDSELELLAVTTSGGVLTNGYDHIIKIYDTKTLTSKSLVKFDSYIAKVHPHKNTLVSVKELGEEDTKVMELVKIEEKKSRGQPQEDADPEYIYL